MTSDEELKALMAKNKAKYARDDAEEMLRRRPPLRGQVQRLTDAGYKKGYDYAEVYARGKQQGEAEAKAKLRAEVWRNNKVLEVLGGMPKKKREYAGVKSKALVPKRGQKAGPLTD